MRVVGNDRDRRVAWLINHTTLRAFEVPLIRSLGLEVLTSKQLPYAPDHSASVDYSHDESLTVPSTVLDRLNQHNYYEEDLPYDVVDYLNAYFGTVICACFDKLVTQLVYKYGGRILVRVFGREKPRNYSEYFTEFGGEDLWDRIKQIRDRFWLAPAYDGIADIEKPLLRERSVTLPLGLPDSVVGDEGTWVGTDRRILFVCPRIGDTPYYGKIYRHFKKHCGDLDYVIAGQQPRPVDDDLVAGWVPDKRYRQWFRDLRVMFYHSAEPRHLHYHPLEAIAHGMPLIFMGGGLLEGFGTREQPGACRNFREAKHKLRRILDGDEAFTRKCIDAQQSILEKFSWKYNEKQWQQVFVKKVLATPLDDGVQSGHVEVGNQSRPTVAVLLPKMYRGGTLQVVKRLAMILKLGAKRRNADLDVVVSCLEEGYDFDSEFQSLKELGIAVRPSTWRRVSGEEAKAIMVMQNRPFSAGMEYVLPQDGCNDFLDCGFWLLVSDRVDRPILPVRRYGVYELDFIQRYVTEAFVEEFYALQKDAIVPLLRGAECVITTTPATTADVNSYAGVPMRQIHQCPLLTDRPPEPKGGPPIEEEYLLWQTNTTQHKNHERVLAALRKYYEENDGKLKTVMVGPLSDAFHADNNEPHWNNNPYVVKILGLISETKSLQENLLILGELPDATYAAALQHARFLLIANLYDNGSFSVIDAAYLGTPTLTAKHPAQEHIVNTYRLNSKWFDPYSVDELAAGLKAMETEADTIPLPSPKFLDTFCWPKQAEKFFDLVYPHVLRGAPDAYK